MGCVRAGRSQAAKVVLSQESRRRAPQRSDVERPTQRPLVRLSKRRRSSLIRSDQISIAARRRAAPRVKPRHHPRDSLHPDVSWQQRIERATQLVSAPPIGRRKTHRLTEGMHPSIGPAGACGNRPAPPPPPPPPHQASQHRLKLRLHGAIVWLALPPCEAAPIVLDYGEEGPARHGGKDATRCHYLTRVIALIPHGLSAAPRAERACQQ